MNTTDSEPAPVEDSGDELLNACLRQDGFFPVLVHELRNLVAPLGNAVHLMRLRGGADPELQSTIQIMDRQVKNLGRVLDKLATADRFSQGGVALACERIDLARIIYSATQAAQALIDTRKQRLHVTPPASPVYLEGNADSLIMVLRDLLENAAKFAADGGEIWLEARVVDDAVSVHVRDNGAGMSADLLSQLFAPYTAGSRRHSAGKRGLGLGLMIARKIVALHKGRISAASGGPGLGSEFVIHLPLPETHHNNASLAAIDSGSVAAPPVPGMPGSQPHSEPQRILIVDDSDAVRVSLGTIVQEMGHGVKGAADGAEALQLAREWMPGIVFLDINLPKLNGYEVARSLRSQFPATQLMLVMMSGESLSDTLLRRAKEAGFDRCVDKTQACELIEELLARPPRSPENRAD